MKFDNSLVLVYADIRFMADQYIRILFFEMIVYDMCNKS